MKGRFQPSTVGNMIRCADGGYVCHEDYENAVAALRECRFALDSLLEANPKLAGQVHGSTTLGNLRAEVGAFARK